MIPSLIFVHRTRSRGQPACLSSFVVFTGKRLMAWNPPVNMTNVGKALPPVFHLCTFFPRITAVCCWNPCLRCGHTIGRTSLNNKHTDVRVDGHHCTDSVIRGQWSVEWLSISLFLFLSLHPLTLCCNRPLSLSWFPFHWFFSLSILSSLLFAAALVFKHSC